MIKKIKQLEKLSSVLEPNESDRKNQLKKVDQFTNQFLENIHQLPPFVATEDEGVGLYNSSISEEPIDLDTALNLIDKNVICPGVKPCSPGYFAYIPGGGLYHSALADYLVAITNKYAGVFFAAPGAVRMEKMLLRWMADFVGYPENSAGDITTGGSIACLTGIVTARETYGLKSKDVPKSVIYLTKQTHHSLDKALRIAGLNECTKRFIPLDKNYRMNVKVLNQTIHTDKKSGLNPWLILASAGTTDSGAVDPLKTISEISNAHNLWLHIDGAYGAAFALCEEGKKVLNGLEHSDSLVLDPHKGLFLPFGTGVILIKDGQKLLDAFFYEAQYLQDTKVLASSDEISPSDLSPELSRHFRSMRLWLPLKLAGVAPFRAALEEKLLLARYAYKKMKSISGFEMGPFPDLSIFTFRYIPKRGDVNEFNQKLVEAVQRDGRIFLSSTTIDEKFTLRLAVLGFRTHLEKIDLAIDILKEKSKQISEDF